MATETRTGFRLPWSLDSRGAADVADSQVGRETDDAQSAETASPTPPETDDDARPPLDASAAPAPADAWPTTVESAEHAGTGTPDVPEPIDVSQSTDEGADTPSMESTATIDGAVDTATTSGSSEPAAPAEPVEEKQSGDQTPFPVRSPRSDHGSSRLLAQLTNAMRIAAEAARETTLSQYRADGKAFVERVQSEATERVGDYRRQADADIAAIRDWSKAEAARIREETDRRISDRKASLESDLQEHSARIEREIQRVEARIASFEDEMSQFFEQLLGEEDPSRFGALAASLPEPPTFEAVLAEAEAAEAEARLVEPAIVEAEPVEPAEAEAESEVTPTQPAEPDEAPADPEAVVVHDEAEVVEAVEAEATEPETVAVGEVDGEDAPTDSVPVDEPETVGSADETAAAPEQAEDPAQGDAEPAAGDSESSWEGGSFASTHDPRLAALGLTPDFAAAEAEAFVDANSEEDDGSSDPSIPLIEDDALAARLSHLTPSHDDRMAWPQTRSVATQTTQVVVVGLVSVASIASFKRHLGRVAGVQSVGVSSGPDGEFVFAVVHADTVDLREVVPSLPGFKARVSNSGDGIVHVTAHDPESD